MKTSFVYTSVIKLNFAAELDCALLDQCVKVRLVALLLSYNEIVRSYLQNLFLIENTRLFFVLILIHICV